MALSGDQSVLVSTDGEGIALWDAANRAHICDIKKATLAELTGTAISDDADISALSFMPANKHHVLIALGNSVLLADTRNTANLVCCKADVGKEGIGSFSIDTASSAIAVADDSGAIHMIAIDSGIFGQVSTFAGSHKNVCSSAHFRPGTKQVYSGGLDSTIMSWDANKGKLLHTLDVPTLSSSSPVSTPAINPPFVFGLSFASDGGILAAALGSGSVAVLDCQAKGRLAPRPLLDHHMASVGAVHFPHFEPRKLLVSGGNDKQVAIWKLGDSAAAGVKSEINWSTDHGSKVNALTSLSQPRSSILVADTSLRLTEYILRA